MTPNEIRRHLDRKYHTYILDSKYPLPYFENIKEVKALLLGCDPSNNHSHELPYVFAINSGLPVFYSFIKSWQRNLNAIGLDFGKVYIQNLCRNYFNEETSRNPIWNEVAKLWIPVLKDELAVLDGSTPILLSSEVLLRVLLKDKKYYTKAMDFYTQKASIPVSPDKNLLNRPLIPFYRHHRYNIGKWGAYAKSVSTLLKTE